MAKITGVHEKAPITNPVQYTPSFGAGFGAVGSNGIFSRRNGSFLEIFGFFTAGTVSAGTASLTPGYNGSNANVTIDTAVAPGGESLAGYWQSASGGFGEGGLFVIDANTIGFTKNAFQQINGSNVSANGSAIVFFMKVPIVGWSANDTLRVSDDSKI